MVASLCKPVTLVSLAELSGCGDTMIHNAPSSPSEVSDSLVILTWAMSGS